MADPDYKRRIAQSFDRAANRYEEAAELQRDVANRLAERLSGIPLPQRPLPIIVAGQLPRQPPQQ